MNVVKMMKRCLAVVLGCTLMAFGQRSSQVPAPAPNPWVIDAVALDAAGRPVVDLTAADFEIVQGGRARKITNFTWFDTRLHTAVCRSCEESQLPALDLLPDEIRRNLVVVVDDLGLSAAGINAVRGALKTFVGGSMQSGDRMAILRSSGGSGVLQQLTGDTRILVDAIDDIRFLGGITNAASAGRATWLALGYTLEGLWDIAGRKAVVVFAEKPGAAGPWLRSEGDMAHAANGAAAAVYTIDPLAEAPANAGPSVFESLARDTGGWFGGSFAQVLQNEQGYYAIGFEPEEGSADPSARFSPAMPAQLKVRRPGVVARSRTIFLRRPQRKEFAVPVEYSVLLRNALTSPFSGADIRARLTAVFSDYPAGGPLVELILHFDPKEISFIHDLQDKYRGGVQFKVAAHSDDGRSTVPLETAYAFALRPADYGTASEDAMRVMFQMKLPGPGAWQVRAVVADGASDRVGSAVQFVEIPNVRQGALALTGLTLRGVSLEQGASPDPNADAGWRIFKPGTGCAFSYGIFNALTGANKQSTVDVRTRILAEGRVVYDGDAGRISFGETPAGARSEFTGHLRLDPLISPGDYILQVIVRDVLAPPGQERTATQFTDFEVRQ